MRFMHLVSIVAAIVMTVSVAAQEKLTVEQVVANHLASIGTAEARGAVKFYEATGTVKVTASTGGLNAGGNALLVSEGNKIKFALKLASNRYSGDQFVFDGKDVLVSKDNQGRRSTLGEFVWWQKALMRDGLLGGVLSTAWPLYNSKLQKGALTYEGTKKVDGVNVHQLRFQSKDVDTSVTVTLLFDAETFRHVRTIYEVEVPANFGGIQSEVSKAQAAYQPTRYRLEESFSDFRQLGPYVLPVRDQISFISSDDRSGVWHIDIAYEKLNGNDLGPSGQ